VGGAVVYEGPWDRSGKFDVNENLKCVINILYINIEISRNSYILFILKSIFIWS
jgi:hypothetical protein